MAPRPVLAAGRSRRRHARLRRALPAARRLAHGAPPRRLVRTGPVRDRRFVLGGPPGLSAERHQRRDEPAVVLGHLHRTDAFGRELHRRRRLPGAHPRGGPRRRRAGRGGAGGDLRRGHRVLLRPRLRDRRPAHLEHRNAAPGLPGHVFGPRRLRLRPGGGRDQDAGRQSGQRRGAGRQAVAGRARLRRRGRRGHSRLRAVPRP